MVDFERMGVTGALTRKLQAISESGWTNVQTPVRQGFEAVETTVAGLAEQLASSREDMRRLEARLVSMEDELLQRLDCTARRTREEVDVLRGALDCTPRAVDVQTTASEACRALEIDIAGKTRSLERSIAEISDESKKTLDSIRQELAEKAGLSDLEAFCPRGEAVSRADMHDLENRIARKADKGSAESSLSTKVSWVDLERLLRDKADVSALAEVEANCATAAALERVEKGLARAVGMEEVRAFVETQTGDIQGMSPALERLLAARAREERDAAERNPASSVTRGELPDLFHVFLREAKDRGNDGGLSPPGPSVSQVHAAVSAGREGTLRTVEAQLARTRNIQQEEALKQEKRLRMELDDSIGRMRLQVDGLGKGLEQAKGELVSLLNAKAYKADLPLMLQGKADSKDVESVQALARSKLDESEYRATSARTLHALTALSGEVSGLRRELRLDVETLSSKLLTKANSDDLLALKENFSGTVAAATAAVATASSAATAAAGVADARQPKHRCGSALAPASDIEIPSTPRGPIYGTGEGSNGDGPTLPPAAERSRMNGTLQHHPWSNRASNGGGEGQTAVLSNRGGGGRSGLSREEARLLIRAELKRAGIANKITGEEASVLAEDCASKALSAVKKAVHAMDLRVRAISDRIEQSTVAVSQPHVERLFAAQSNLELRMSHSLSLGRWLWRGVNFSEMYWAAATSGATSADDEPGEGVSRGGSDGGGLGVALAPPTERLKDRGIWVPWEREAANSSPECLQWIPGGTRVTAVVPGLYLLSCGFFFQLPFVATVYLNRHRVFSFFSGKEGPRVLGKAGITASEGSMPPYVSGSRGSWHRSGLGRYEHPAGEILATSAREYLACPAGGEISIKFDVAFVGRGESRCGDIGDGGAGGRESLAAVKIAMEGKDRASDFEARRGEDGLDSLPQPQGFLEVHKL